MDTIFIKGIHIHAHHGCLPEEQALGQRFIIHLELDLDLSQAGSSDKLEHSVNYAEVHTLLHCVTTTMRFNLIEALAETIAQRIFAAFPPVAALRITLEKPSAPIAGIFDEVGVTLRRQRSDYSK